MPGLAPRRGPLWPIVLKSTLLLGGVVAVGLVLGRAGAGFGGGQLDRLATGEGVWSPVIFVLAGAAYCAVGLPRQGVAFAAGYAFGLSAGIALSIAAQMIGCVATVSWARAIGRASAARRVSGRLARIERFVAANPFTATLMVRLLPVGNNVALNALAGVSAIPAVPFLLASLLGYVPQTLIFVLLGAGFRVGETTQVVAGLGLFVGSLLLGLLLLRRRRLAAITVELVVKPPASDADSPGGSAASA